MADTLTISGEITFATSLLDKMIRHIRVDVEDWHDVCKRLPDWEDVHLVGNPSDQARATHARILDQLESVGKLFCLMTASEDFPDRDTAELIANTIQDLKDSRALWHGKISPERKAEILNAFNEQS